METLKLESKATALILIDLQQGVVANTTLPHAAMDVVKRCAALAETFRKKGSAVIYVHVDMANLLQLPVDQPSRDPNAPPPPLGASELVPEAGKQPGDTLITKRFWDAFGRTDLEKILRERGTTTIVLGGISTNFGVESTARTAASLGFAVILAEDTASSRSVEAHRFAIETIFPRLGRVRSAKQIEEGLVT
jgi:nicotinamidase-related amidase